VSCGRGPGPDGFGQKAQTCPTYNIAHKKSETKTFQKFCKAKLEDSPVTVARKTLCWCSGAGIPKIGKNSIDL